MLDAVELRLPPDTQHVGLARLVVVTAARRAGMGEERVEDLRIAVSEATTNAILTRQRDSSFEQVTLRFGSNGSGQFEVTVAEGMPNSDSESEGEWSKGDGTPEGRLGVTLMRGLADKVEFVREEGKPVQLRFVVALHDDAP